jgi:hypothetical protein
MILAHVSDSWTRTADRTGEPWYIVAFIGGVASPLFLFLAGVATAMAAVSKGVALARRRGWEIFGLGLVFRLQSQMLGMGPLQNLFKVDMLNIMGLSIVLASYALQATSTSRARALTFALITGGVAMVTPIVRALSWLSALPDPIEAYLRPAGPYAAFPFFPWAGFLFAGVIVGVLVNAAQRSSASNVARHTLLHSGLAIGAGAGVLLAWLASFQPSIYESASFWHDSPTFFFIRLGLVTLLIPIAWVLEQLFPGRMFLPMATLGHSSLFVYWVHIELVYGVIAEPIKRTMPLWLSLTATAALSLAMYGLVLLKNRYLPRLRPRSPLRGPGAASDGAGSGLRQSTT